jgi:hypothetical protein
MTLVSSEDRARHRLGMRDRSTRITMHNIARGRHRWSLCKSAFTISVERAANMPGRSIADSGFYLSGAIRKKIEC